MTSFSRYFDISKFLAIISVHLILVNCVPNTNRDETNVVVNIKGQGLIKGNYDTTAWTEQRFMKFQGVPYAESPSGALRFKAPVERKQWKGYLDATHWGRRCPIAASLINAVTVEDEDLEDCLNLCVYTKNLKAKAPVMVYVHGGGFYNGTSSDHPPNYLMEKDIVLVVPQYRIGGFGIMSTGTDEIPGNAAIADILFALEWVKRNIATFGGDPDRITIFGQSAGAAIINAILISPKTPSNLFQRAILQSGSIFGSWATFNTPREQSQRVCNALGCHNCDEEAGMNACLMNADVKSFLKSTQSETLRLVIGDKLGILPTHPKELFKQFYKPVSVMIGYTKHDGSYAFGVYYDQVTNKFRMPLLTVRQFISGAEDLLNDPTDLRKNLETRLFFDRKLLDSRDHMKALPAYFDIFNVLAFKSPAMATTSQLIQRSNLKTYLYTFDYEGEHTRFGYEMGNDHYPFNGGIHHSNDNIYLFSTHPLNFNDTRMAKKMVDYWTSFAINGTPYSQLDGNVQIPHMETESGPYFHINKKTTIEYDAFNEFTVTIDDPENYKLYRPKMSFL